MSALSSPKGQLKESHGRLFSAIREAKKEWNDPVEQRFEKLTLETVGDPITHFISILELVGKLIDDAKKEIGEQ